MNIIAIGGSHGIGYEYYKKVKDKGDEIKVLSRTQGEVEASDWKEFDSLNYEYSKENSLDVGFEKVDALLYFPGTVNLGPFDKFSKEDLKKDLDLNVVSALEVIKATVPLLKKSDKASISLLSSVVAQTGMSLHSQVGISKAAVEGLIKNLAAELAPKIRVNGLALSLTETPLTEKITKNESAKESSIKRHPLNKIGDPDNVADMLMVLTHFAGWMTGEVVKFDGGISAVR